MLQKIRHWIQKHTYYFMSLTVLLGASLGYLYWQQIGCASGQCAITSNPINSTLYGAAMGYLLGLTIVADKKGA